jgi:hypothetical protein
VVGWSSYNETLVRCREIVLDFDVIDSGNKELETMNDGKKGESIFIYHIDRQRVYLEHMLMRKYQLSEIKVQYWRVNTPDIKINERIGNDIVRV